LFLVPAIDPSRELPLFWDAVGISGKQSKRRANASEPGFCEEKCRLQDEFLSAVQEISSLQSQQTQAVIEGATDFSHFDAPLHLAMERKEKAKYEWMAHVEGHGCGEL
jgi:hypothetical protein